MPLTRSSVTIALLLALLLPALAEAKAWQGIEPGKSTAEEVVARFGEPTTRKQRGARSVVAYKAEQALPGTKEVQFHCRTDGVVEEITVFLSASLDADSVEGTFGKPQSKTFVEATFQKVWLYPAKGVTVYFDKESNVDVISYTVPATSKAAAAPATASPAAEKAP
jgi:outer membrane protein assembly factor BamE (lipoprotein component of BamABCDE complex)